MPSQLILWVHCFTCLSVHLYSYHTITQKKSPPSTWNFKTSGSVYCNWILLLCILSDYENVKTKILIFQSPLLFYGWLSRFIHRGGLYAFAWFTWNQRWTFKKTATFWYSTRRGTVQVYLQNCKGHPREIHQDNRR